MGSPGATDHLPGGRFQGDLSWGPPFSRRPTISAQRQKAGPDDWEGRRPGHRDCTHCPCRCGQTHASWVAEVNSQSVAPKRHSGLRNPREGPTTHAGSRTRITSSGGCTRQSWTNRICRYSWVFAIEFTGPGGQPQDSARDSGHP
jgi:hypothetical protein